MKHISPDLWHCLKSAGDSGTTGTNVRAMVDEIEYQLEQVTFYKSTADDLRVANDEYKRQLTDARGRVEKTALQNGELQSRLGSSEKFRISQMTEYRGIIEDFGQQKTNLQDQLDISRKAMLSFSEQLKDKTSQMDKMEDDYNNLEQQLKSTRQSLESSGNLLKDQSARMEVLKRDHEKTKETLGTWQTRAIQAENLNRNLHENGLKQGSTMQQVVNKVLAEMRKGTFTREDVERLSAELRGGGTGVNNPHGDLMVTGVVIIMQLRDGSFDIGYPMGPYDNFTLSSSMGWRAQGPDKEFKLNGQQRTIIKLWRGPMKDFDDFEQGGPATP